MRAAVASEPARPFDRSAPEARWRRYDRDVAHPREERIAKNEASFRALNESIETEVHGRLAGEHSELRGFVCECGDPDCVDIVRMTTMDYEAIRRDPRLFLVRPGHQAPDVEDVVRQEDVFLVVRKHDEVAEIVEATDPRAG